MIFAIIFFTFVLILAMILLFGIMTFVIHLVLTFTDIIIFAIVAFWVIYFIVEGIKRLMNRGDRDDND